MIDRLVVQLSPTALAGAPAALNVAVNEYTRYRSVLIQTGDYASPGRSYMAPNAIRYGSHDVVSSHCRELLRDADIIHIHNTVAGKFRAVLATIRTSAKFIYHVHSPMYERPLFVEHAGDLGICFSKRIAVCHFHPRCYQEYLPVPNIVLRSAPPSAVHPEQVSVLFSPSHRTGGRWNAKTCAEFEAAIDRLRSTPRFKIIDVDGVSPEELFSLRRSSDITIDEVVTGSFHLVSCEGLAAGNVVVNGADRLSILAAQMGFRTNEAPPFVFARPNELVGTVKGICSSTDRVSEWKAKSKDYFDRYLCPERLAGIYEQLYAEVLS